MTQLSPDAVILITGATGAIGSEIAAQAAAQGAMVGVHGSTPGSVAAAIEKLLSRVPAGKFVALPGDFRDPGVIASVISQLVARAGRLDALIHCAITGAPEVTGVFSKTNPASFGMLAQNVLGILQQLCFEAMPHLSQNGGSILAFASDAGRFAAPRQALLGAAYGGIMSFVRNLAVEAAREQVRVNCLSPSFVVDTPVFDRFVAGGGRAEAAFKRAGLGLPSPKDIAPLAIFLSSPDASKITGQVISINGGLNA